MSEPDTTAGNWAKSVADMAADALLDCKFVTRDQVEAVRDVIAEEIYLRLCLNEYPPAVDFSGGDAEEVFKHRSRRQ